MTESSGSSERSSSASNIRGRAERIFRILARVVLFVQFEIARRTLKAHGFLCRAGNFGRGDFGLGNHFFMNALALDGLFPFGFGRTVCKACADALVPFRAACAEFERRRRLRFARRRRRIAAGAELRKRIVRRSRRGGRRRNVVPIIIFFRRNVRGIGSIGHRRIRIARGVRNDLFGFIGIGDIAVFSVLIKICVGRYGRGGRGIFRARAALVPLGKRGNVFEVVGILFARNRAAVGVVEIRIGIEDQIVCIIRPYRRVALRI